MSVVGMDDAQAQMRKAIMAIMMDTSMSEEEKSSKRQDLLMGRWSKPAEDKKAEGDKPTKGACMQACRRLRVVEGGAGGEHAWVACCVA